MKKIALTAALFVLAMFGLSSAASATITSPGVGTGVTANGRVTLRGSVVNTVCNVVLRGTVASGTVVNGNSGTSTGCTVGTLTFRSVGDKVITLGRTWSVSLNATLVAPIVGTCIYSGVLSGTWAYNPSTGTELTITGSTLTVQSGSGGLCIRTPIVTGVLTLLGVVTV